MSYILRQNNSCKRRLAKHSPPTWDKVVFQPVTLRAIKARMISLGTIYKHKIVFVSLANKLQKLNNIFSCVYIIMIDQFLV